MSISRAFTRARALFSSTRASSRSGHWASGQETPPLSVRSFSFTSSTRTQDMDTVHTEKRLAQLRELMKQHEVDIYVVPSEDSHQSEYVAACDGRREYISGFSGSAGTAVITLEKAALATDGRYFNQASKQLDENWELLKQGLTDVPTWSEWTAEQAEDGKTVGVDPTVITAADARKLSEKIKKKGGKELKAVPKNLVDIVWGTDRPPRPNNKVEFLPLEYSGKQVKEKLVEVRKELEKKKCAGFIVSMLDEIAWLYNLRGSDIPYNPVFFSYAAIDQNSATLYIDKTKLTPAALESLEGVVDIKPYDAVFGDAEAMKEALASAPVSSTNGSAVNGNTTLADIANTPASKPPNKNLISNKASWALYQSLGGEENVEEARSPIGDQKACKNETELAGMRACHIRDGAALIEFFAWLEEQTATEGAKLDEVDVADKLEEYRSKKEHFVGLSFPTISSTGANAAIIHYKPERGNCSVVDPKQVYLCDSGAQYLDGTTDTTRTVHFGEPTSLEKTAYTLVLKGNIALERAKFPKGTSGFALDTLARQFLWNEGLDYRHGTGHGVGSYLNVHEGPIGIGTRIQYSEVPLSIGNVISDEPGYYEDNKFGIRIENIIMVKEVTTNHHFGDKPYLGFEHVTMVPHCRKLIDNSLLTPDEKAFIDEYHAEVLKKTDGLFEKDGLERTKAWVERECAPL